MMATMSLAMMAGGAAYEFRWRRWALLRDCVVHHLEGGAPASRFPLLVSIGRALGEGGLKLDPALLAAELRKIQGEFAAHKVTAMMLGPETPSVLYLGARGSEAGRVMTESERREISATDDNMSLAAFFEVFFSNALAVCQRAAELGAAVEVVDL